MRIFIGIELDEAARDAAADAAAQVRRRVERAAPDLSARWIGRENLHVTIWFLGERSEEQTAAVVGALRGETFSSPAFRLTLTGCGAFPPAGPPRILWIGAGEGTKATQRLHGELGARLAPLGYVPERRDYTPHLTIARIKHVPPGATRDLRAVLGPMGPDVGTSQVTAVTLFQSRLSPKGASYEPLLRVPLV